MTLLEKAKNRKMIRSRGVMGITDEHIELAIAWAKGEVSYSQAAEGYGYDEKNSMKVYIILARSLREAFTKGILK
jgi:hypothetical protein